METRVRNRREQTVPPSPGRCYWLREAMSADPVDPAPQLRGELEADVVVLGGGYTGMWTAWFLLEHDPGIRVVVVERDLCGGGPSGRNGGFASGWWDELPDLVEEFGDRGAVRACLALDESIQAIDDWCRTQGIDAWYRAGGYLMASTAPAYDDGPDAAVAEVRRLGHADRYLPQTPEQVRARCNSSAFRGGAFMPVAATVQPARLALGLRRRLLERGVRIFERSPVVRFTGGPPVVAETTGGRIRAGQGILALNAWTASLPAFRRRIFSWGSYIVLTAPAPERLEEIGWTGGECITDFRHALHYFRTTADGRVAFGGGGGRVGLHPGIGPWYDYDDRSVRRAAEGLRHLLPALADVPIEEAWGGPIDVSPGHLPFFGSLAPGTLHYGVGYTGNGVAPSHLAGRILSALALARDDPVLGLPLVNAEPRNFPPEPLRTAGAHLVREAVVRWERAQDGGRRPSPLVRLIARSPRKLGYRIGPH